MIDHGKETIVERSRTGVTRGLAALSRQRQGTLNAKFYGTQRYCRSGEGVGSVLSHRMCILTAITFQFMLLVDRNRGYVLGEMPTRTSIEVAFVFTLH